MGLSTRIGREYPRGCAIDKPHRRTQNASVESLLELVGLALRGVHTMSDSDETIDRREFLSKSAALIAGGAALPSSALSYERIVGANDRLSLAHIGTGSRGSDLDWIAAQLKTSHSAEMTVVCDLWKLNREKAAATNAKYYGRAPRTFQYLEDVLALKDVDGVIISTPEHSHSPILKMAAEAGKDAYVEKPMGNVLAEVKAARDAVLKSECECSG